jgi:hypothetical protein
MMIIIIIIIIIIIKGCVFLFHPRGGSQINDSLRLPPVGADH